MIDIVDGALSSELETIAQSSLSRQQDLKARSSLLAVLQDMITELDADDEDNILAREIYGRSPVHLILTTKAKPITNTRRCSHEMHTETIGKRH